MTKKKLISNKDISFKIAVVVIIYIGAAMLDLMLLEGRENYLLLDVHSFVTLAVLLLMGYGILKARGKNRVLELTLIEKKIEMAAILDNIPDITWLKDKNARYLFVNRQFSEYLGIVVEAIIGKTDFEIWDSETAKKFSEDDEDVFLLAKSIKKERSIAGNNNIMEWMEIFKSPIFNEEGDVVGTVGIARNITERKYAEYERKELEIQLRQSQKMEAIGTLAGGIAHDFNNILAAVMGYAEIALEELPKDHQLKLRLERILSAGSRGKELVNQILTFSRQQEKEHQPVNLSSIVEEALKMLRPLIPSTIDIHSNLKPSLNNIMADPTQIHQVIMNLCTNSSHAMRLNGGNLDISVEDIHLDEKAALHYMDLQPGPHILLTVTDTGHGLDKAVIGRIFEPFFTTKKLGDGTGMGLSVVHGIVKGHKGTITVDSEPGKGTTFKIFFPSINGNLKGEEGFVAVMDSGDERIMVVDDESAIVDVTREMLESLGYTVDAFNNSLEALECFKENIQGIDLVITDQTMPSMTGEQLSKMIKEIRPTMPIVMLTGYSEEMTKEKALEMGIEDYIMKPFVKRDLAVSVRKTLDRYN